MVDAIPPQDLAAEQAVLGSCLIERPAILAIAPFLRPEMFLRSEHAAVWQAILDMDAAGEPVDLTTLTPELIAVMVTFWAGAEMMLAWTVPVM